MVNLVSVTKASSSEYSTAAQFVDAWSRITIQLFVLIIIVSIGTAVLHLLTLLLKKIVLEKSVVDFSYAYECQDTEESSHPILKFDRSDLLLLLQVCNLILNFSNRYDAHYLSSKVDRFREFYEKFFGLYLTHLK